MIFLRIKIKDERLKLNIKQIIFFFVVLSFGSTHAANNECSGRLSEAKEIFRGYINASKDDLSRQRKMVGCISGDVFADEKDIDCRNSSIQDTDPNKIGCRDGWKTLPNGEIVMCIPVFNYSYCRISTENRDRMLCAVTKTSSSTKVASVEAAWYDIAGVKCFDLDR